MFLGGEILKQKQLFSQSRKMFSQELRGLALLQELHCEILKCLQRRNRRLRVERRLQTQKYLLRRQLLLFLIFFERKFVRKPVSASCRAAGFRRGRQAIAW